MKKKVGGKLTTKNRNQLPKSAFAMPEERKYPIKVMSGGKAVASKSHAANAKARATQMVKKGKLSESQKSVIDRKANTVLSKSKSKRSKK